MTIQTLDRPAPVAPTQAFTASLTLNPPHAEVGDTVAVSGAGYPPNSSIELVWYTVRGQYELTDGTEFVGQTYEDCVGSLGVVQADAGGEIRTEIVAPLDFGGAHDVRGRVARRALQASLTIRRPSSSYPRKDRLHADRATHCRSGLSTESEYMARLIRQPLSGLRDCRHYAWGGGGPVPGDRTSGCACHQCVEQLVQQHAVSGLEHSPVP